MKWIKKILVVVPLFILALVSVTWIFAIDAKSKLAKQYPAPGQLVDVGGYKLHIHCVGQAGPAVVMDAGLSEFSLQWAKIQAQVSTFGRACAYDRAGLGWSDSSPYPRTSETMVKELHALLEKSKLAGPYILVGHSFGGMNMRWYAKQFPDEVKGLILVDATHEEQTLRVPVLQELPGQVLDQLRLLSKLNSLGLLALSAEDIPDRGLSGEALAQYRAILATTQYFDTAAAETEALKKSLSQVRDAKINSLGAIPLVVLSRGLDDPIPGATETESYEYQQTWKAMQAELVKLSTSGRQVIATRSGHSIHLTEPRLVVDAIRSVAMDAEKK